eukprot:109266-Rhodomonas_salina.1
MYLDGAGKDVSRIIIDTLAGIRQGMRPRLRGSSVFLTLLLHFGFWCSAGLVEGCRWALYAGKEEHEAGVIPLATLLLLCGVLIYSDATRITLLIPFSLPDSSKLQSAISP